MHELVPAQPAQDHGGVVFVHHIFVVFPDVDVVFTDGEEHFDVFLPDHVSFAENRALFTIFHNPGNVVAENLPDGIFCSHQFHSDSLLDMRAARTAPVSFHRNQPCFASRLKYFLLNSITFGERRSTAKRFGIAIKAFMLSAICHTRSSLTLAPITTKTTYSA